MRGSFRVSPSFQLHFVFIWDFFGLRDNHLDFGLIFEGCLGLDFDFGWSILKFRETEKVYTSLSFIKVRASYWLQGKRNSD